MRETKFFGSPAFRRLWFSQVFSSTGDWVGIFATTYIANTIAGPGGTSLVLAIRLGLAFFFASFAGVLVDRYNRKHIMVLTLVVRAAVFCALPFVDTLVGLVLVSLALELMTLMYSPAKEASVPNLVKPSFLPTASSLSLTAAYGSALPALALLAVLSQVPTLIAGEPVDDKRLENMVALFFNAFMYLVAAAFIATLTLRHTRREPVTEEGRARAGVKQAAEGFKFVMANPRVRGVVFGLAAGLIGGGSVVPLGPPFANDILGAGISGFTSLLTAMGVGLAIGIVGLTVFFKKVHPERLFVLAIFGAGVSLGVAATMNGIFAAAFCIGVLGLSAGAVYVIGFTTLQTNVSDEIRGRVFATFYTLTRVAILAAIAVAPIVSLGLDRLSDQLFDRSIRLGALDIALPGVRLTLLLSALIILAAGVFVLHTFRRDGAFARSPR